MQKDPEAVTTQEAIDKYVRERLDKECHKRGMMARIARFIKFDPAHVHNVRFGHRRVGEDFARRMAEYWGVTYPQLEQLALGVPLATEDDPLPNLRLTLEWCAESYPGDFLRQYGRLARKLNKDRLRREWLDDIDAQLRRWARGFAIEPMTPGVSALIDGSERPAAPETHQTQDEEVQRSGVRAKLKRGIDQKVGTK